MSYNIVRPCTAADSGHEEGRALDWMVSRVPAQKAMGDALVAWLQAPDGYGNPEAMARRLGISYVIWNNQTWRAYDPARGWTEYNGCSRRRSRQRLWDNDLSPHARALELHLGRRQQADVVLHRLRRLPGAARGDPDPRLASRHDADRATRAVVPAVPVTGPVVPLPPSRVLGTQLGTGTPAGPCRVHPDVRLDVAVGGSGGFAGVPLEGVAAVVLRVRVVRPDAAFQLRVWPAGSTMPVDPAVMDASGKVTEVTVPLGVSGRGLAAAQRRDGPPPARRARLRRSARGPPARRLTCGDPRRALRSRRGPAHVRGAS